MQISHLVLSIILPSSSSYSGNVNLWSQHSKTAACCCHPLPLTPTSISEFGKNPLEKPGWMWSFASFVSLLLGIIAVQILPALGALQFLWTVALYILSRFYNYFGKKIHLIQAIPLWPEPEAVCYFHLLSPSSQKCLGVGSKSFCWQAIDLILVQFTENGMTS